MFVEEQFKAAMANRDVRFDGVFFVAVRTTHIYCRPVCRVRMPRFENVEFYPSAAAAENAGYRACLRCRPEAAPFSPAWNGTKTTVERAMRLIDEGALDNGTVEKLADRLGVGSRHLLRLFRTHVGASPTAAAATARMQRAKRLLNDCNFGLDEIAERSGYPSVRSMNSAFLGRYGRMPTELRPKLKHHTAQGRNACV